MYTSGFPIEGIGIRLESGPQVYSMDFPIESKGIRLESGRSIGQRVICRRPTWDIAAGTAWDNCVKCEHLSPTHNLSQALTTDLPAKLS